MRKTILVIALALGALANSALADFGAICKPSFFQRDERRSST